MSIAIGEKMKNLFNRATFANQEAEYTEEYFDEEGNPMNVNTGGYDDEQFQNQNDSDKVMRFTEGTKPKARFRYYTMKGQQWSDVVVKATKDFKAGCVVLINTEDASKDQVGRMRDFMAGVAFSNGGELRRPSSSTHLFVPANCEASGDEIGGDIYEVSDGFNGFGLFS